MITPSFSLTATERVLPRMALDFTTATLDPRVTFTRSGNTATVTNSSGVIAAINANLPRFDFNPTTLVCNGLLIEESRTNLLLNSLLNGTNLSTQLITTTAVAHTLSFYGTGQIVLTGTSSATVTGTGAYPARQTLTFTPTVGVLTLTVTGTVQYAQLEVGAFATSFIPTAGATVTRNVDVATMTGTNFSDWYNASEGAFVSEIQQSPTINNGSTFRSIYYLVPASGSVSSIHTYVNFINQFQTDYRNSSTSQASLAVGSNTGTISKSATTYKVNSFAAAAQGGATSTDVSGTVPASITQAILGNISGFPAAGCLNGYIRKLFYYPQRLTNAEVQAFSK